MAVLFTTGSMTLVNWEFGAGDIAVMAGAGRAAGTWVMVQVKDRALVT